MASSETAFLVSRRHWIVLLLPLFFLFLFAASPLVIYYFFNQEFWYLNFADLFWFLAIVWWLILWNLLFFQLTLFVLNTLVVTNLRVIENQQKGFFDYAANEFSRDKVQDATVKIRGLFGHLLNYGDVEVQTAGTQPKFYFWTYPDPEKIKEAIVS